MELFQIIAGSEQLAQRFDIERIFLHIAEHNGAKNIHDFIRVQTQPDEMVQRQAEAGNMVPATEAMQGGII